MKLWSSRGMSYISMRYCRTCLRAKAGHLRLALLVLSLLAWCTLCAPSQQQPEHIKRWFDHLDSDRDGQLQQQELRQFVGANLGPADYNTQTKLDAAVEQITVKIDGSDSGLDISVTELDQYLHRILEGVKVSDWIIHSLGLPQYAQTFKDNAITVLDFPMLVNDGGQLLETELQVTSVLHRHRIMQAMQRQMLGLGSEPGPIQHLTCKSHSSSAASNSSSSLLHSMQGSSQLDDSSRSAAVGADSSNDPTAAGAAESGSRSAAGSPSAAHSCVVTCSWEAPQNLGDPALHKYVLERFALQQPGSKWEAPAELDDDVFTQFTDRVWQPGVYQYRLAAWNLFGRSSYVLSNQVSLQACAAQVGRAPWQQQQHADGLGVGGTSDGTEPHFAAEHTGSTHKGRVIAGKDILQRYAEPAVVARSPLGTQQHTEGGLRQQQQQAQQRGCWPQQQHSEDSGNCSGDSCNTALAVPARCDASSSAAVEEEMPAAASMRHNTAVPAAAGGGAGVGAGPPNVVWVVGADVLSSHSIPSSAAAALAQTQLLASMQAAAGNADADNIRRSQAARSATERSGSVGLATFVGSQLWSWLRAGLNSLLLLVLPLLVRLLPVPVLHQLAAAAVKLVKLLPPRVQQMLLPLPHRSDHVLQSNSETEQLQRPPAGARSGMVGLSPDPLAEIVPVCSSTATSSSGSGSGGVTTQPSVTPLAAAVTGALHATTAAAGVGREGSALLKRPAYRMPHTLSAPVVSALDPAAFGCSGALPSDAAALGLHSSVHHMPESFSVGALQLLHSDLSSCGLRGVGSALSNDVKNANSSIQRNASSSDLRSTRSVTFKEPRALLTGYGDCRCIAVTPVPPPSPAAAADCTVDQSSRSPRSVANAAGTGGASYSHASFEAGGLQLAAALEQQGPNRKRCAYPGCQQQFDLRHFKALRQRHYCGRCQQAFCLQHTAYSPHGPSGSCGAESRCVCVDCFYEFTPEYRLFLTLRNTLVSRRAISGPPVSSSSSSEHAEELGNRRMGWSAVGRLGKVGARSAKSATAAVVTRPPPPQQQQQQQRSRADGAVESAPAAMAAAENGQAWPGASGHTVAAGLAFEGPTDAGAADSRAEYGSSSSSKRDGTVLGKMLWARGLGKAKAVVRFKQAGRQHQH